MDSSSQLDTDFNITKKKVKNSNIKISSDESSSLNQDDDVKTENIVDVTAEIRVDVLRLLTIIKKMEAEKLEQDVKIKELNNKIKEFEEKLEEQNNSTDNTCGLSESVMDLNEYEIKLDKFKAEMNDKFIGMQKSWRDEFAVFRQNIIEISRIKR